MTPQFASFDKQHSSPDNNKKKTNRRKNESAFRLSLVRGLSLLMVGGWSDVRRLVVARWRRQFFSLCALTYDNQRCTNCSQLASSSGAPTPCPHHPLRFDSPYPTFPFSFFLFFCIAIKKEHYAQEESLARKKKRERERE